MLTPKKQGSVGTVSSYSRQQKERNEGETWGADRKKKFGPSYNGKSELERGDRLFVTWAPVFVLLFLFSRVYVFRKYFMGVLATVVHGESDAACM